MDDESEAPTIIYGIHIWMDGSICSGCGRNNKNDGIRPRAYVHYRTDVDVVIIDFLLS